MTSEWRRLTPSLPNPDTGTLAPGLAETRIASFGDQGLANVLREGPVLSGTTIRSLHMAKIRATE